MSERTMVKLSASEDCVRVRTLSRNYRSPQSFIFTQRELIELEEKHFMTVADIHSFAKLSLQKAAEREKILKIDFTWLNNTGGENVAGRKETIRLSYEGFKEFIRESQEKDVQKKMLSLEEHSRSKIEFRSRNNLKAVIETKTLRKKLGKFMGNHFLRWKGSRQITLYDDFEPYSFFFQEQTPYGAGMCGGVILHDREDLGKAYYGMHT